MVETDVLRISKYESVEKRVRKKTVSNQQTLKIFFDQYVAGTMSMLSFFRALGSKFVLGTRMCGE
ncbi:hypothetical protein DPMN_104771 [Dreissena polymorpha]|uniref:Uncharacterized protein n=1 Tax=Dreissena polymorpha TaxID=45954 RepID=A0A9D4HAD3_DREPO|nr:hypothetical protein DPMN_104771 [Dreissena polymorpha]